MFHILAELEPHFCIDPHRDYHAYVESRSKSPIHLGWVKVTHVATAWRMPALGDATLWTNVTLVHGRQWAAEILRRSCNTRIRLQISTYGPDGLRDSIDIMRQGLSRATELDLIFSGEGLDPVKALSNAGFPATASQLKVLKVCSPDSYISMEYWQHFASPPSKLHTPQVYDSQDFDWRKLPLGNLTTLAIGQFAFGAENASGRTVNVIREALSQMTRLEALSIVHGRLEFGDISSSARSVPIELSLLKTLNIDAPLNPGMAALLRGLRAPKCDNVTLQTSVRSESTLSTEEHQNIAELCSILTSTNFPFQPINTLELKSTGTKDSSARSFSIAAWTSGTVSTLLQDYEVRSEQTLPKPSFSIIFGLRPKSGNHPFTTAMLLDHIPWITSSTSLSMPRLSLLSPPIPFAGISSFRVASICSGFEPIVTLDWTYSSSIALP